MDDDDNRNYPFGSALHMSIAALDAVSVEMLLQHGATITDNMMLMPWIHPRFCVADKHVDAFTLKVLKVLVQHGGNVNVENSTAFRFAVSRKFPQTAQFLAQQGADIWTHDVQITFAFAIKHNLDGLLEKLYQGPPS